MRLTKAAVQAAELGQWDDVIRCYQERGVILEEEPFSILEVSHLLTLDELVRERVHTAQVLLQSLIEGAGATRSQLQGLRQKLAAAASTPEHLSLEV